MLIQIGKRLFPRIIVLPVIMLVTFNTQADSMMRSAKPDSVRKNMAAEQSAVKKQGTGGKKQRSVNSRISRERDETVFNVLSSAKKEVILAKIADKTIYVDEFIRRAEYTIRPSYCKGDGGIEKKIVLNSLIAEKLLALDAGKENELTKSEIFQRMLEGEKEQLMRQVLYYAEGTGKVNLKDSELQREYNIAGRTYHLEYFNVPEDSATMLIGEILDTSQASFYDIFRTLSGQDSLPPKRDVSWTARENKPIRDALFKSTPIKGQIIGPVLAKEEANLFLKVNGWTDRVAITDQEISTRWNDVREELSYSQAEELYEKYVVRLMEGKKLQLRPAIFEKFVKLTAPLYFQTPAEKEQGLAGDLFGRNFRANRKMEEVERNLQELRDNVLLTIGNKAWTVEEILKEMQRHPLVFRTKNLTGKNFTRQLKLALADMVRDRYLADEAYKRGYDSLPNVVHYTEMWHDAIVSLWQRSAYLESVGAIDNGKIEVIKNYLNPYIDSLRRKYSDTIEINTAIFNHIRLTRIDMIALQNNVPFALFVPAFPQLTTYQWLDYGRSMDSGESGNSLQTKTAKTPRPLLQQ